MLINQSEAVAFDYCKLRVVSAVAAVTAKLVTAGAGRGKRCSHGSMSRHLPCLLIGQRSLAFDLRPGFFDSHLPCNANAISLSALIVGPMTTRKDAAR